MGRQEKPIKMLFKQLIFLTQKEIKPDSTIRIKQEKQKDR